MADNNIIPGFDDEEDDSLKITIDKIDKAPDCLMLTLTGYIDTYNSNLFQKRVVKAIETGFIKLIFQCANLNYVSSTGMGSFTSFLKIIKPQGGNLVMMNIQPKVYEVFQLLGFSHFFNIKYSLDECISFLNSDSDFDKPPVFPIAISCPLCRLKLKVVKSGRFRCSKCKTIIAIDQEGQILLG